MAAESEGSVTVGNGFLRGLPLPRRGGGAMNADAAKSASEKLIICASSLRAKDACHVGGANNGCREGGGWKVCNGWRVGGMEEDDCLDTGAEQLVRKV